MAIRHIRGPAVALIVLVAMACTVLAVMAQSASAFVECPTGGTRSAGITEWRTLWPTGGANARGVTLCKGTSGSLPSISHGFLQIADLRDGAKIRLHADVDPESPPAEEIQPRTLYRKRTARSWYSWLRSIAGHGEYWTYNTPDQERLFSVTNATFFTETRNETQTTLPFPLHTWGGLDTLGLSWSRAHPRAFEEEYPYEEGPESPDSDYEYNKKALLLGAGVYERETQRVEIRNFPGRYTMWDPELFFHFEFEPIDAAVSLPPETPIGTSNNRTYLGVYREERVYIFTSTSAYTNLEMLTIMNEIKPGMQVIQLDGGGSTQFYSAYGEQESTVPINPREVPTVLAIYRAE